MTASVRKILFVFGTRPEAIKLAPVIRAFRNAPGFSTVVAVTAQHRQMLDQVLAFFEIVPDHDLDLMRDGQTLSELTASAVTGLDGVMQRVMPDMVIVQGDTTSAFCGALCAYYRQIPVAHVEAGLRSHDKYAPFPEEINRVLTGHLSDLHFAPTPSAAANLMDEHVTAPVHVVGNSVVDALLMGREQLAGARLKEAESALSGLPIERPFVLVTGHRRESFGKPFEEICGAIADAAAAFPETSFIYPVHLNPNVSGPVHRLLSGLPNVYLSPPLDYPSFLLLMGKCQLILTDSGGIQEEAPALGKPVLVMREVTERREGIEAGTARLVGVKRADIFQAVKELLSDQAAYGRMSNAVNPYGDGRTSERIVSIVSTFLNSSQS
ncbi:MAG: hypothetical protein RL213_1429 [Bacteroidota bacterium]|jgi:UDP-N-acetylglucosamine 2-epimerase (non-hydrolysing)